LQRLGNLRGHPEHRIGAQVEVVGGQIGCRSAARASGFSCLQGWLDDTRDAGGDLVLQVEHVFERAVEAVGPEMRAASGVDQLRRDAHTPARLADRAFENVADTQLPPDLLHVDRLAFVRKTRIAGDDKEPSGSG